MKYRKHPFIPFEYLYYDDVEEYKNIKFFEDFDNVKTGTEFFKVVIFKHNDENEYSIAFYDEYNYLGSIIYKISKIEIVKSFYSIE